MKQSAKYVAKILPQIIMGAYFLVPIKEGWNEWGAGQAPKTK